jgi:hypothetical protein
VSGLPLLRATRCNHPDAGLGQARQGGEGARADPSRPENRKPYEPDWGTSVDAETRSSAVALEQAIHQRSLLDILTHAAYLTGWHRHLGPASGSDPKIRGDVLGRYVLTAYAYGANLGAAEVARHMRLRA